MKVIAFALAFLTLSLGTCLPEPAQAAENTQSQKLCSKTELNAELESLQIATDKFESLGVGVSPYRKELLAIANLLETENFNQASPRLLSLKRSLEDQQRRFYAAKVSVWQKQKENLIRLKKNKSEKGAVAGASGTAAASGLSRASHSVLSKDKGNYTPLIYPIAR